MSSGTLYIVSTPIGNLKDITYRAVEILSSVDLILCEDTRRTKVLCREYGINVPLKSYYNYVEESRTEEILPLLFEGKNVALVSDSGTPGISDPGYLIIRKCVDNKIKVVPVPGPTAFVSAVVCSGLPLNKILFLGFLPRKTGQIEKIFQKYFLDDITLVFYESPYRIKKTLEVLRTIFKEAEVYCVLGRELTKVYEEFIKGKIKEIYDKIKDITFKGEVVGILYRGKYYES